jgi:hypothetical protein
MSQKKRSQPPKRKPVPPADDLLAAIDHAADSYRTFLVLLARLLGALPEEGKP